VKAHSAVAARAHGDEARVSAALSDIEPSAIEQPLRATLRTLRKLTSEHAELLDRLELEFDAERAEGYGLDPELVEGYKLARPSVTLVPRDVGAAPIVRCVLGLSRGPRPLRSLVHGCFPDLRMRCVR
jgi:hypothetical protein